MEEEQDESVPKLALKIFARSSEAFARIQPPLARELPNSQCKGRHHWSCKMYRFPEEKAQR